MIRRTRRMCNFSAKTTPCKASHKIDSLKNPDPLVIRKRIELSDSFYRKGSPEHELMRTEFSCDTEFCLALAVGIAASVVLICAARKWKRNHLSKKYERAIYRAKYKS